MHDLQPFQDVISRDRELPNLSAVLNEGAIASRLGMNQAAVSLDYIRYKPQTNCLARFRLADPSVPYAYAKTVGNRDDVKIAHAVHKVPDGCKAPLAFEDTCLLYQFPTDAKVNALTKLTRKPLWVSQRFSEVGDHPTMELMAYKPERRCVLKLLTERCAYVLKLFTPREFEPSLTASRYGKHLLVKSPTLEGKSRRYGALLFEFVDGPTLREEIDAGRGELGCSVAGQLLAAFHQSSITSNVTRHIKPVASATEDHGLLNWLIPDAADSVSATVMEANARIRNTPSTSTLLHGDFYDKQLVLAKNGHPVLIDLDQLGHGDHRIDVANFVAHLLTNHAANVETLVGAFLQGYERHSPNRCNSLGAYVALAILKLAHHSFRTSKPDWHKRTINNIEQARHWLSHEKGETG